MPANVSLYILPNATRTVSETSDPILSNFRSGRVFLNVSAISGDSAEIDIAVQAQDPLSLEWIGIGSGPSRTSVGLSSVVLNNLIGELRVVATISGTTPSIDCSLAILFFD